ncbi:MAG TPA: redoxin domain-containing protein, partial [Gemmatimonadales bacterium]|nr:redoxin domain-containing protein [Gemmatimonadales bacterium]
SHRSYVDKMEFNFPLLSDPERAMASAYNALKEDGKGIQRTVYVIGKDGTVRFAQRGAPPVDDIVAVVDA